MRTAARWPWSEQQAVTILVLGGLTVLAICGVVAVGALIDLA